MEEDSSCFEGDNSQELSHAKENEIDEDEQILEALKEEDQKS